ncbi:trypsin [Trichuris suis]|nr:trypsin [Trichuris suis]
MQSSLASMKSITALLAIAIWLSLLTEQVDSFNCGYPKAYGGFPLINYIKAKSDYTFPWTVVIARTYGRYLCLGSIVPEDPLGGKERNSSTIVLTAGNCFKKTFGKSWGKPSRYTVVAGVQHYSLFAKGYKSRAKYIRIVQFKTGGNDQIWDGVAAVYLRKPLIFGQFVSPVCLAFPQFLPNQKMHCFVTQYSRRRFAEEPVEIVPGAKCDFGDFPEMARAGGLCALKTPEKKKKYLGAPLVCIVRGIAFQYGIYLSELAVQDKLSIYTKELTYFATLHAFLDGAAPGLEPIILGNPKNGGSSSSSKSSSSSDSDQRGKQPGKPIPPCRPPSASGSPHKIPAGKPICAHKPKPKPPRRGSQSSSESSSAELHVSTVKVGLPHLALQQKQPQIKAPDHSSREIEEALRRPPPNPFRASCGDVSLMENKRKNPSHQKHALSSFPWDALIATKKRGSVRCIGSLVHQYPITYYANISDLIVTAGYCFHRQRQGQWLDVSGRFVYVAPGKHSFLSRTGIKREIESGYSYPIPYGTDYIRDGIAMLKLKQPVPLGEHAQAVCLPQPNSLPPPHAVCFYSRFYKSADRIYNEKVPLTDPLRCLQLNEKQSGGYEGICTQEQKKRGAVQLGSPLVCYDHGRLFQYGVYLTPAVKNAAQKDKKTWMGFYGEMTIVHRALSERRGQHMSWEPPARPKPQSNGPHMPHPQQKRQSSSSSSSMSSEQAEHL